MSERLPEWANSSAEVAGLLMMLVGSALYTVVIVAQVWRNQAITVWPLPALVLAGAVVYTGHRVASVALRNGGVEVTTRDEVDENE